MEHESTHVPQPAAPAAARARDAEARHEPETPSARHELGRMRIERDHVSGRELPRRVRAEMEAALSADLGDVRVVEGDHADHFDAHAVTWGRHVFLPPGVVGSSQAEHRRTVAHELTHVVQQREGRVRADGGGPVHASAALEAEADRAASLIGRPGRQPPTRTAGTSGRRPGSAIEAPIQLKPKWRTNGLRANDEESANPTFVADIAKRDGLRTLKVGKGIAKKQVKAGEVAPDSAVNIGVAPHGAVMQHSPRMLARQVTSWKLAKSMGLDQLHARERYAKRKRFGRPTELYGVSEFFQGGRKIEDLAHDDPDALEQTLQHPAIQKQLSDLQLFDAITGQSDRHMGNVMIGPNHTVKAIDNDQSFPAQNTTQNLSNNQVASFAHDQAGGGFRFTQRLIDHGTAQTVLGMNRQSLAAAIQKGTKGDETLNNAELDAAEQRLLAVKAHIQNLQANNQLVGQNHPAAPVWGPATYQSAIANGATPGVGLAWDKGQNNVWAAMKKVDQARALHAADADRIRQAQARGPQRRRAANQIFGNDNNAN